MTHLNVSRNNLLIFLADHDFLGLGKLSTTMKRLSVKTETLKKSALDHRKIYLYKVKDFIVWLTFVLSLLSLLEFLKQQHMCYKTKPTPSAWKFQNNRMLSRELSPVRIAAVKRTQACPVILWRQIFFFCLFRMFYINSSSAKCPSSFT